MNQDWPKVIAAGWHPVAYRHELGDAPVAAMLMGTPLVLFQDGTVIKALLDRCPHRNVPLSRGRVDGGLIACPYHGWRFSGEGKCVEVPGSRNCPQIGLQAYQTIEREGLIWVSLADDPPPFPELWPELEDNSLDVFWWPLTPANAGLLDALENHLDPAHPHYLHPWLVRKPDKRKPVAVELTSHKSGAVARYTEENTMGWLPRLFERERKASYGKLFGATTGQVSFEDDRGLTIAITVIFSPVDHGLTRPYAHFASRKGRLPAWIKKQLVIAFHRPVLAQDKAMLAIQREALTRFGAPHYAIGPLDFMGPVIWKLANGKTVENDVQKFELLL
jgi:phenylpropionate dioxygenase-like ring-hydroxylating dioxygenase large terminal subunit